MIHFSGYIMMDKLKDGPSTPKYVARLIAGDYKPFEGLRTCNGIGMYLCNTRGIVKSPDGRRADKFLQAKDSLNLTSIYVLDYESSDGSIVAFGNPPTAEKHGKKQKPNPFYGYGGDAFLFLITKDKDIKGDWSSIEMLVVDGGINTILGNAKALADGEYNDMLNELRASARPIVNCLNSK